MTLRVYLRRSKSDVGAQEFSLDTQRSGAQRFVESDPRLRSVSWSDREEYVDDGRAGDDFTRPGLQRLLADAQVGDVVVARDSSRIGRDNLEVALAIRTLVRDRSARLYFYVNGEEAKMQSAVDTLVVVAQATGSAQELEQLKSRTREGMRSRVRSGRSAGGAVYGYANVRTKDDSGRASTELQVDPAQAAIIVRIYREYAEGAGYKTIAQALNAEGIPFPKVGRRGSGEWSAGQVRDILLRQRYVGIYEHGKVDRVRKGDRRVCLPGKEVIHQEIPSWRIVDDILAARVRQRMAAIGRAPHKKGAARGVFPLSGVGRCAVCGGGIGTMNKKIARTNHKSYGCSRHWMKGGRACPETCRQPTDEVEQALARYLTGIFRQPTILKIIMDTVEAELRPESRPDAGAIEAELANARRRATNLTSAIAEGGGDVAMLVQALREASRKVGELETVLAAAKRPALDPRKARGQIEAAVKAKLDRLAETLSKSPTEARDFYRALFPDGLRFEAVEEGKRRIWNVEGIARILLDPSDVATPAGFEPASLA